MADLFPPDTWLWRQVEEQGRRIFESYGYQELRYPLLERSDLFLRSIGSDTDIVAKEMYSFTDRDGEALSLRPEGTASCVRACLQQGLLAESRAQRFWYSGAMFRRERPQKGRRRQFHQLGVESFGMTDSDIEAELIAMSARLWRSLGLAKQLRLQINTLGDSAGRQRYRSALVEYCRAHQDKLDEDSRRRIETNPLRILDSKDPGTRSVLRGAPVATEYLAADSRERFAVLQGLLDTLGIAYEHNPYLVRGLDYYNGTVFEWVADDLGAQNTVCGGGRYDGLVQLLGGKAVPAAGFALGMERLCLLLAEWQKAPAQVDAYMIVLAEELLAQAMQLAEECRTQLPELRLQLHCGGGSLKSQLKKAHRSGAARALILGPEEAQRRCVMVKELRGEERSETAVDFAALPHRLGALRKQELQT